LTNSQYGFHRDELEMIDNARHLDWGFVGYPPLTPFLTRVALELFGPSLVGVRLFAALAQSAVMVLAGLMARELGASRFAQGVAALAAAIAPIAIAGGAMLTYSDFDSLWWVTIAYLMIRLLKSDDPRWWLGIGAAFGLGLMTKYTILIWAAAIAIAVVLTRARRHLVSPWLWGGVALALLIFLPNLIWQIQHDFISLDFMRFIHARDIRIGRTQEFLSEQLVFCSNPIALPLWVAGLVYTLFLPAGKRFRALGWMAVGAFALLRALEGRSYYFAPVYPMLIAGGVAAWEKGLAGLTARRPGLVRGIAIGALAIGGVGSAVIALPIAPVHSPVWRLTSRSTSSSNRSVGRSWSTVAASTTPACRRLATNGHPNGNCVPGRSTWPSCGLPDASAVNSYRLRGWHPPPQGLIMLDWHHSASFETCEIAGSVSNRYGVRNEETGHSTIYLCRRLRHPWPAFWESLRSFG
jgi:4-amino-4-deoxy-L-arabinose transferase-like glycosyltransferase